MRAVEILNHELAAGLRGMVVKQLFETENLIQMVERLPDRWGELIFTYWNSLFKRTSNLEVLAPTLMATYMFACGWLHEMPQPWEKTQQDIDRRNDPEWEEYLRLCEKFKVD